MNKTKWIEKNCRNLKGKKVVITGATGGLGKEICFSFAHLGADLILACRNLTLAENLKKELLDCYPNINVDIVELDFAKIESVVSCVEKIKEYNGIDILINNAGVYNIPLKKLDSGFNNIFQINYVYTYFLTRKLLSELEKKKNSVCITLGSVAYNYSKTDKNDVDFSSRPKPSLIYGNSKRFLMISLYDLFKNSNVRLSIVHPGVTLTNMTNHYPKAINWLVKIGIKLFFPNPKKATLSVNVGADTETKEMEWIGPKFFNVWGYPKKSKLKNISESEYSEVVKIANDIYNKINTAVQ